MRPRPFAALALVAASLAAQSPPCETGMPANTLAVLLLGSPLGGNPVPGLAAGCLQFTTADAVTFALTGTGNTRGPTMLGHVRVPIAIPANPGLAGFVLGAQIAAFDAGSAAALPFATSNGLSVTVF